MAERKKIPSRDEMFKKIMPSFSEPISTPDAGSAGTANGTADMAGTRHTAIRPVLRSKLRLTGEEQDSRTTATAHTQQSADAEYSKEQLETCPNTTHSSPYIDIINSKLGELMGKFKCCQCAGCKEQVIEETIHDLNVLGHIDIDKEVTTVSSTMVRAILRTKLTPKSCDNR